MRTIMRNVSAGSDASLAAHTWRPVACIGLLCASRRRVAHVSTHRAKAAWGARRSVQVVVLHHLADDRREALIGEPLAADRVEHDRRNVAHALRRQTRVSTRSCASELQGSRAGARCSWPGAVAAPGHEIMSGLGRLCRAQLPTDTTSPGSSQRLDSPRRTSQEDALQTADIVIVCSGTVKAMQACVRSCHVHFHLTLHLRSLP